LINLRIFFVLFFLIQFVFITFCVGETAAQMTAKYPRKLNFSGLIELSYNDYYFELPSSPGKKNEYHTSFIEQRYGLSVGGFIYHPRLAVFNAGIKFTDRRQLSHVGGKTNSQTLGYNLLLTFLPYRPVTLALYAGNTDYTIKPIGDFINPLWERKHDINHNYYGARLKVMRHPYPFMRLEYRHEEHDLFSVSRNAGTVASDRYTLDVRGNMRFWRTSYQLLLEYYDFSSPSISYEAKKIRLNVRSIIRPGIFLHNSFVYTDIDFSKLISLSSNLSIDHRRKIFNQYYAYRFTQSEKRFKGIKSLGIEGQTVKQTINSLAGSWTYRFTQRYIYGLVSSLSLNYGLRDEDDEDSNFYGINFTVSYSRPFIGLNFAPRYRLLFRKDDLRGQLSEQNFLLDIVTRNLRWGTIYSNYSFTLSKEISRYKHSLGDPLFGFTDFEMQETKTDSVIHSFRTGVRGRVPGQLLSRAQWNLEAEVFHSDATIEKPRRESFFFDEFSFFESDIEKFERKIRRYSLISNISYPAGWALIFFSSGYTIGKTNDRELKRFFIEQRVQYPVFRNLYVNLKWKKLWEKIADYPMRKVDEYSLSAEYRMGRTTLSATGSVLRSETDSMEIYFRRFFLLLRRTI
jgi:hypothetical protein